MESEVFEKRKFHRVNGRAVVQFRGENFIIYSNLSSIGEGGLFVDTYYLLDKGEEVTIRFELPEHKKVIDVRGKVVRHRAEEAIDEKSYGLGVAFNTMDDQDRLAVREYISSLTFID